MVINWKWLFPDFSSYLDSGSSPAPPDPVATANAQTNSNQQTAQYNAGLNRFNQYTPFGSQTWTQTGGGAPIDRNNFYHSSQSPGGGQNVISLATGLEQPGTSPGSTSRVFDQAGYDAAVRKQPPPQWSSHINLSPEMQAQLNASNSARMTAFGEANKLAGQGYDYSPNAFSAQRDQVVNAINSRMEPQFARDEEAMRTRLVNQGITDPGQAAYGNEYNTFNRAKTDARQQAILAGGQEQSRMAGIQSQGIQNQTAIINALNGSASGIQSSMPQFNGSPGIQMPGTDISGLIGQNYQSQLGNASNQTAANNANTSAAASIAVMAII